MRLVLIQLACWAACTGALSAAFAQTRQEAATRPAAAQGTSAPVTVTGEVANPGNYFLHPGENLRQLLHRAGGLRPQAHLFGIELRRHKEQLRQQEDLNDWSEYLQNYSQLTGGESLRHSPDDNETSLERLRAQHELIVRLHKIKAGGRVVLELDPEAARLDDLPEVPLEAGDRIVVPARCKDVRLLGKDGVDGGFVFHGTARTEDLLGQLDPLVGELPKQTVFVLRANGRVLRYAEGKPGTEHVRPGDSIVLGDDLNRVTLDQQVRAWWSEFLYHRAVEYTGARFVGN